MGIAEQNLFSLNDQMGVTRDMNKALLAPILSDEELKEKEREEQQRKSVEANTKLIADSTSGYDVNTVSYQRADLFQKAKIGNERFGKLKSNIAKASLLGAKSAKNAQDVNDFFHKIVTPDAKGNLKIQDQRTIGWADASAASFFLSSAELSRGITSRNANNIQINKNLMYGGLRSYFEDKGVTDYDNPYDDAVAGQNIFGDGFNMNPLNYAETFDALGIMDSPDLMALRYKDKNFDAKSYLDELVGLKPDFVEMMRTGGIDLQILKETGNVNEFWWQINRQTAMIGAATTIANWRENVPEYQEWAMTAKDFVRDSLLNDPDFAGELVLTGALTLATGGVGGLALLGTTIARRANKGRKAAKQVLKAAKLLRKVARTANNTLPQNWGLTIGHSLRNTQVGRFLAVQSDDYVLDGVKFGTTRRYGSKLVGYTFAELPAGFIEEGMAGAYNAYDLNRTQAGRDQNILDAFVDEGIAGSVMRAFGINPVLRGFNYAAMKGTAKINNWAMKNLGDMFGDGDGMGWQRSFGSAFMKGRQFLNLDDIHFLDNEIDSLELMIALDDINMTDAEAMAAIEGTNHKELIAKHPALATIAEMMRFDQQGSIMGRNKDGTLKIVELVKEARRRVAINQVNQQQKEVAGYYLNTDKLIEIDPNEDLTIKEDDTPEVKAEKAQKQALIDENLKTASVGRDEFNMTMLALFWGKLDQNARDGYEAKAMRDRAYFQVSIRELAMAEQARAKEDGEEIDLNTAMDRVLQDPDLLTNIDNSENGIARELNQLVAEQHPELFEEAEDSEGNTYFVPNKSDSEAEQLIAEYRRSLDIDAQLAAIKAHRLRLGIVKDVRFAIDDALNNRIGNIFKELNRQINAEASYKTVIDFLTANENSDIIVVDDGKGDIADLNDADIVVIDFQVRGVKETQTLNLRRPGTYKTDKSTSGRKVVKVSVYAKTIEAHESLSGMLNKLQVTSDVDIDRALEIILPDIKDGIIDVLDLNSLSDEQLLTVLEQCRKIQGRPFSEGDQAIKDGLKRDKGRRRERKFNARTAAVDVIAEVLSGVVARDLGSKYFDAKGLDSADILGRAQDKSKITDILTALQKVEIDATMSDLLIKAADAFGIELPAGMAKPENRKQRRARAKEEAKKAKTEETVETDVVEETEEDTVEEEVSTNEEAVENVVGRIQYGFDSAATTEDANVGDSVDNNLESAKDGTIATADGETPSAELTQAAEIRNEEMADDDAENDENKKIAAEDTRGQQIIQDFEDKMPKLRKRKTELEDQREALLEAYEGNLLSEKGKEKLTDEDKDMFAAREDVQAIDKELDDINKQMKKLSEATGRVISNRQNKNKDNNEKREERREERNRRREALAPVMEASIGERIWAQLEVRRQKMDKANGAGRKLNTIKKDNSQPTMIQILAALGENGYYNFKGEDIAIFFRDSINTQIEADKSLSKKEKERKKLKTFDIKGETKVDQKYYDQAFKEFIAQLKSESKELTQQDLRKAQILAMYGQSKLSAIESSTNGQHELELALDGNSDTVPISGKPFSGVLQEAFDPTNRRNIDMSDDEKTAVLDFKNQLQLIKTLERSLNNMLTLRSRKTVTGAELASFALSTATISGETNAGRAFSKLNWNTIFSSSAVGDSNAAVQYYDIDSILDELMMHKARLEYKQKGKKRQVDILEAQKESLSRDEYLQDEELLLEETLELAENDAETLKIMGRRLFTDETSSLRGIYFGGIDTTGNLIKTKNESEYEELLVDAIANRLGKYSSQVKLIRNIANELVNEGLLSENFRDLRKIESSDIQDIQLAVIEYLKQYPGNENNRLSSWGNGQLSYSFADQVGMGVIDTLAGITPGSRHETMETFDNEYDEDGAIINAKERVDPRRQRGAPLQINMAEPMLPGKLEKFKEDHSLMMVQQFVMELDLTEAEIQQIFDWAEGSTKEAVGSVADRNKFIAGERPMPRIIFSDPSNTLQSREDIIADMTIALSGIQDVLLQSIHDAYHMHVDGEQMPGGFLNEEMLADLHEEHGLGFEGTAVVVLDREGKTGEGAGEVGGFATAAATFGSHAYHLNRSWGKMYPAFRDTAIESLAAWESFTRVIEENKDKIGVTSATEFLSDKTYFDGNFNGIHHKMALVFTIDNVDFTGTGTEIRDAVESGGDALDQYFFKFNQEIAKRYKSTTKQDYYVKVAHDVLVRLSDMAFNSSGVAQENAANTIRRLQETGFLPEDLNRENYRERLKSENINKGGEFGRVRDLFKKSVMVHLYGAGRDTISKEFTNYLNEELGMTTTEAQKIALPLTRVALGYGLKERQLALTELARPSEESILGRIVGDRNDMDRILLAMRVRMDAQGFNAKSVGTIRSHIKDLTFTESDRSPLTDITFDNLGFQIQMRDQMVEDLIVTRLGYPKGSSEYNRMKGKINKTIEAATAKQKQLLEERISRGLDKLGMVDLSSSSPRLELTADGRNELSNVISIVLTTPKSEWRNIPELAEYLDEQGNLINQKAGDKLDPKKNLKTIIRLIKDDINRGITREEAEEVQRLADEAVEGKEREGLFRAVKAMNEVGRTLNMDQADALMEFAGVSLMEPSMRKTLEKYYKTNRTYRGVGRDGYAGRWYGTEHDGTHQGPKGAQNEANDASEPLLAMGAFRIARNEVDNAKAEEMFARYILARTGNTRTDQEHVIITLAKERLRKETDPSEKRRLETIIAILTPDNELTDIQKTQRSELMMEQWLDQYQSLKIVEENVRNSGGLDSLDAEHRQRIKLSSGLTRATSTQGMDPAELSKPSTTVEELESNLLEQGQNHGLYASRAKAFDTSFRNMGVPLLKADRIHRTARNSGLVSTKITSLKEFQEQAELLGDDDARLITSDVLDNVTENSYSTDEVDLMYPTRDLDLEDGIGQRSPVKNIDNYSRDLENSLINFAHQFGLMELVKEGRWQEVDYYRQTYLIRERNYEAMAQELRDVSNSTLTTEKQTQEVERIVHFYRRKTQLQIRKINQRYTDNATGTSSTAEMAPGGNVSVISSQVLTDRDGNPKTIGQILNSLRNDLNNLGSYGVMSPVEGVAMNDLTRAQFRLEESTDQPRIVHASDAAHILTTIYDKQVTGDYLRNTAKGKELVNSIIRKNGLTVDGEVMTVDQFVADLPNNGLLLTLDQAIFVMDEVDRLYPDLAEQEIESLANTVFVGNVDQRETERSLSKESTRRGIIPGTGQIATESTIYGTTGRFRLTLSQARQALLNIRNSSTLELITDTYYTGINNINRPKSTGHRLDEVDQSSGRRIADIRLQDEIHAEALELISDRHRMRKTNIVTTELNTKLDVVVGGRDRSLLGRIEGQNRQLPRKRNVPAKDKTEQAIYLDYSNVQERTNHGQDMYADNFKATVLSIREYDPDDVDYNALDQLMQYDTRRRERAGKPSIQKLHNQKIVLGYLATHFAENGSTVNVDGVTYNSVEIATALAFLDLGLIKPKKVNGVLRQPTLAEVLKTELVTNTSKLAKTMFTASHVMQTGEANKYYDHARGFVMNMMENPFELSEDSGKDLEIQFLEYLQKANVDVDLASKTQVDLAKQALRDAMRHSTRMDDQLQSRDMRVMTTVTPEVAVKDLDNTISGRAFKEKINAAVPSHISQTTADIILTVVARISAVNPDFLSNIDIQFGTEKSRALAIPAQDKYLVELSTADGKKDSLSAAKVLIHELVHVGTFRYYSLDSSSTELNDIRELMNQRSVQKVVFDLTKAMNRGQTTNARERHREYMNKPEEFIAEAAAMYWMTEANVEIDKILSDAQSQVEATDSEDAGKKSFIQKFKTAIFRQINHARNTVRQMSAILTQYDNMPEFAAERNKLKAMAMKAAGVVVENGEVIASVVPKPNTRQYTRHIDGSVDPTRGDITDAQFKQERAEIQKIIATIEKNDSLPEDLRLSTEEIARMTEEVGDRQNALNTHNHIDDFGVSRSELIDFEEEAMTKYSRTRADGTTVLNLQQFLQEEPDRALALILRNMRTNNGGIVRNFIDRQMLNNRVGVSSLTAGPSQNHQTYDSIYDLAVQLSLAIDSTILMTSNMINPDASHDMLRAKQRIDNQMAFLRGELLRSEIKPEQHPTVMMYVANPEMEAREGEEAVYNVAQMMRTAFADILDMAKETGILYGNLDYDPVPIKLNEQGFQENQDQVLEIFTGNISNRIESNMNNVIDPFTLLNSGLIPPMLLSNEKAKLNDLTQEDKNKFTKKVKELSTTKEGRAVLQEMIALIPGEQARSIEGMLLTEIDEWSDSQILTIMLGTREMYKKGFQQQGFKRGKVFNALIDFVNLESNRAEYIGAINSSFKDTHQLRKIINNKDMNVFAVKTRIVKNQTELREMLEEHRTPASLRASTYIREIQTGVRFLARDKVLEPNGQDLMNLLSSNEFKALNNSFIVDPELLMDGVATGIGFDAIATKNLGALAKGSTYEIEGVRFDDILAAMLEKGTGDVIANAVLTEGVSNKNAGTGTVTDLRDHLTTVKNKYDTLAGRRQRIDKSQGHGVINRLAAAGNHLVLATYGGNLTVATALVEGSLTALQMAGRGDMVLGPARMVMTMLKEGSAGAFGGVLRMAGMKGTADKFKMKNTAAELSYAHTHATIRGLETDREDTSLVTESTLDKLGATLGALPKTLADASTGASSGVTNAIKYHVEGMAINTLTRLIQSGGLQRAAEFLSKPENQDLLKLDHENMKADKLHATVIKILKAAGLNDFAFLGKNNVKVFMALADSGLLRPDFLSDLNDLIQTAGLETFVFDGSKSKYDPGRAHALTQIAHLQKAAMMTASKDKRDKHNLVLSQIKEFVNREIESRFVGGNPLMMDTLNDPLYVLTKIFRSYPTLFFNQRLRYDSRYFGPIQNATRILNLVSFDIMYMVMMEAIKQGFDEDRMEELMEQLTSPAGAARLISRTPTFGLWGGVVAAGMTEILIAITGGKGYTQNLLNQGFLPVPLQKIQGLISGDLVNLSKYGSKGGIEEDARFNLALYNLLTALPVLQEGFVKAAIQQYMFTPSMNKLMDDKQKRASPEKSRRKRGSSSSGGSRSIYYQNPSDPLNNPGMAEFAADRNIWPDELLSFDIMSVLAHQPLTSMMGPEPLPEVEELKQASTPPTTAAPPPVPPAAPQGQTMPSQSYLPTVMGDPSSRLATALNQFKTP